MQILFLNPKLINNSVKIRLVYSFNINFSILFKFIYLIIRLLYFNVNLMLTQCEFNMNYFITLVKEIYIIFKTKEL